MVTSRQICAALAVLLTLQVVMLAELFAGVPPHPPEQIALFGIAPFLSVSLATAVAALVVGPTDTLAGRSLSLLAGLLAMLSYGPQKYVDPQFPLIWPAVVVAQLAVVVLVMGVVLPSRSVRHA